MSLEFAVQYACRLRARYSEEVLRAWGRLGHIHTRITTGDTSAPTSEKLSFVERSRYEIERMQMETAVCRVCPARLPGELAGEGESVGCLGRVTYPIEAQFEKFIADRAQLALDTLDEEDQPRLLRVIISPDSPFDGEGTKELRRVTTPEGLRFFELRLPIQLARAASHITTDHLFDMLAGFNSLDGQLTTYTRELPLAAAPDYYDFLDFILRNDLSASERTRLYARGGNYAQFLRLLAAMERAEALRARVLLD
ncbi:MAG: hypothetical protein WKF30_00545 [Pyrinomonadaceae bacterium]